jgi:hypothetical protein
MTLEMSWYSSITLGDLLGDQSKETSLYYFEYFILRVQGRKSTTKHNQKDENEKIQK